MLGIRNVHTRSSLRGLHCRPMATHTIDARVTDSEPRVRRAPARTSHTQEIATVLIVVALLVGLNLVSKLTVLSGWVFTVPIGVGLILLVGRAMGITWKDIGLSRETLKKGLWYGAVAGVIVMVGVAIGLLLPITRPLFLDEGFASMRTAILSAFVIIPLQTVLPEELAFRGVLHGSLAKLGGLRATVIVGSGLFGLWHVTSSLDMAAGNQGLTAILGQGTFAQLVGIGIAVVATSFAGLAFTWLRHRSESILAPMGLHWAFNGCGALAAAFAFQM